MIIVLITSGCILQKGRRGGTPLKVALSFCVTAYFRPKCGVEFNLTKISTINLQGQRCTKVSRKSAYFSLANSIFLNTTFFHLTVMLVQHCLPKIRRLKNLFNPKRVFFAKVKVGSNASSTWRWFYLSKTSMKKDPCPIVSVVAYREKKRAAGPLQNTSPSTFLEDMLLLWIVLFLGTIFFERSPIMCNVLTTGASLCVHTRGDIVQSHPENPPLLSKWFNIFNNVAIEMKREF